MLLIHFKDSLRLCPAFKQSDKFEFQNEIGLTMNEAFDCCIGDLGTYADTAREFSELPEPDSSAVHAETDVESLQTRLSRSVAYPGGIFGGLS